jgi:hypothetical protein
MASVATTLIGGSAAANASPAVPGGGITFYTSDILFNGSFAEYLDQVSIGGNSGQVQVSVVRGADRSAIFNSWIGTTFHRDFAIEELNSAEQPIVEFYFSDAYIVQVDNSSNGQEQAVVIDAASVSQIHP